MANLRSVDVKSIAIVREGAHGIDIMLVQSMESVPTIERQGITETGLSHGNLYDPYHG